MYLLACDQTGEAVAIDPLDHTLCVQMAADNGWQITKIINSHHHSDHIGGNPGVVAATGAKVHAHEDARHLIPDVDIGLTANDVVAVGNYSLTVLETPGHTKSDICLYYEGDADNLPALFSGDVLFNAGAGNCIHGGDPEILYESFAYEIAKLSDNVRVFPGHDYIENNLRFTLDREPDNSVAKDLLDQFAGDVDAETYITDLGLERRMNVFMRLDSDSVVARLQQENQLDDTDPKSVFVALRSLRNRW